MLLTDFHIHSNFSDGKHSIPEIVDFYGRRGFDAIAITDHLCETNSFLGHAAAYLERTLTRASFPIYLEIINSEKKRALNQYGMNLIAGVEITKNSLSNQRSAHIIGLNIREWINPNQPIAEILIELKKREMLSIAAHPVSNQKIEKQTLHLWNKRSELESLIDAWEVGSGTNFYQEVASSGLRMIASTDLHRFSQINGWKTYINSSNKTEDIFQAIKDQKLNFHFYKESHGTSPFPHPLEFFSSSTLSTA